MKIITRNVWILSLVSLFTDMASEMLYPVMPLFLRSMGYTAIFIGVLEGVAEAVAGLSKGYFGKLSDAKGKRLPFVQLGYALSAISKPMLALLINSLWIFLSRTVDRLGKGIRTGARDALLSDECEPKNKARVFGFHRSLDTLGAVFGPALALVYLYFHPGNYIQLFLIAFIPGLLAIICTLLIKEKQRTNYVAPAADKKFFAFASYWKNSSAGYRQVVAGLLLFALFNSSDVFLLLRMKQTGIDDTAIIGVYIFYNLVFAILAYPLGILADKLGLKKIFILGLVAFAAVYVGFSINNNLYVFIFLLGLYGLYAAATEGISKAWITHLVNKNETATAIGMFSGFQSIAALGASSLCGLMWFFWGATATFLITAAVSILVVIYLLICTSEPNLLADIPDNQLQAAG